MFWIKTHNPKIITTLFSIINALSKDKNEKTNFPLSDLKF